MVFLYLCKLVSIDMKFQDQRYSYVLITNEVDDYTQFSWIKGIAWKVKKNKYVQYMKSPFQAVFEFGPCAFEDGGLGFLMRTSKDVLCKPLEVTGKPAIEI